MSSSQYTITHVQQIINATGTLVREGSISSLVTDSRQISNPAESIFFALNGRRNGHAFIKEAYEHGVRNFIVTHLPDGDFSAANFLIVDDVLKALQKLAAYHRSEFNLPVIGVTGSNGKTIVKEWLYQLMAADNNIVRNPKSYNSQIGVPLSVWQIRAENTLGIFEAGISTINEMDALQAVIQPTIGVLTHLGSAHDEGFESTAQKITEKLKLFINCNLVVCNYDQITGYAAQFPANAKHFTWSFSSNRADLYVFSETVISKRHYLRAVYNGQEIECLIPFLDEASIENAVTCWAVLLAMGYSPAEADKRLEHLTPVSMRLEMKTGINDCSVIDDSYNSDVQSLAIALNFLQQQNQHKTKTLILSDIYQSGLKQHELYGQVAEMVKNRNIDRFVAVGDDLLNNQQQFAGINQSYFFKDTADLLSHFQELNFNNEAILIKGSRSFEFERVSKALSQKAHETMLEINLNALLGNLNFYKSKLKPGVRLMAMVKAFSYGSGTFEVANILQYNKVDYLAVAYIDEGVALREAGITLPIMVLNPEPSAFDKVIEFKLEPEIYSFGLLDKFIKYIQNNGNDHYPVHIKIDTGMHRLGFEGYELSSLCDLLSGNPYIHVVSVFSHLVASDAEAHDDFTRKQIERFEEASARIEAALGYKVIRHLSNTSGITRWPEAHFDMVRLGIGLYGIDGAVPPHLNGLQPIAKLKTSISQIRSIKAGETVGYNRNGSLQSDGRIATVRIGYADGYLRAFGNGVGKMLLKGVLVPTVGNIAMDMCMIDVSDVDVAEGDEVYVFNEQQTIEDLAKQIGTIPYEILTNISQRVKRVYFYE
ncbi:bifunctional UDP-N-acetylmuramoyl-tripeptide:D-alanyl-D-alanine ligase/alanine racemase [Mucilaginibacter aquatilis]|uniref:Alanine racemase n=1 Tax=Mucilaginibacter aquatilis TaxID=1517760 RepID=A0A6I4I7N9_9SPHI|nr:bifunctional UDP-N-acetylmuramoyl-tripeptide:D-alanyl-D-alanine ligase/alanine racemase [Mucilaginibacter aquatilis]MVN91121.1 bifunctional UDP-N-acetylmuramoyl-tripeptide:D-alanyl-D-alanine ligase/alanine racemase [Mucilaginibacter aquatilis]